MKKIALVFPGQGSQSVGMLQNMAQEFPSIIRAFQEASDVLGYDVWQLIQAGPVEKLNLTAVTQPVLLAASVAIWRVWQEKNATVPVVLAGHSLGEYSALVCAGVISYKEALKLVERRGELMQAAVPAGQGAMAAIIMLAQEQIRQICSDAAQGEIVAIANINAPGQIVIAGHTTAVERAMQLSKTAGAKLVKRLEVSVPSHCLLMEQASIQLSELLDKISWHPSQIPVVHNVDVCAYNDVAQMKSALARQLSCPVRWVETVEKLQSDYHVAAIVECGAGKVLTGMNKRITDIPVYASAEPAWFQEALANV